MWRSDSGETQPVLGNVSQPWCVPAASQSGQLHCRVAGSGLGHTHLIVGRWVLRNGSSDLLGVGSGVPRVGVHTVIH